MLKVGRRANFFYVCCAYTEYDIMSAKAMSSIYEVGMRNCRVDDTCGGIT